VPPRAGIPLALTIRIVEVGSSGRCSPYRSTAVDIWHCDAEDVYSGVDSDTDFLRGYQVTDANGAVTFRTIFPGWYRGRAIHIHLKVRAYDGATETYEYTSQLFFSETTIAQAYGVAPYSANDTPDTSNAADGIYAETGGTSLVHDDRRPVRGLHGERDAGAVGAAGGGRRRGTPARKSLDARPPRPPQTAGAARAR
jgi:protocatechuate 3,4-dioxygenase beta subunit